MTKEDKCMLAETVCECLVGLAIGTCINETVLPKCNGLEKMVVILGSTVGAWAIGRGFAKTFYKFCDDVFDTDFSYEIDNL